MDIEHIKRGEIRLSMRTFTTKMIDALGINPHDLKYPILTPGRTDKKIVREQEPEIRKRQIQITCGSSQLANNVSAL
jgi:hypothetical protein